MQANPTTDRLAAILESTASRSSSFFMIIDAAHGVDIPALARGEQGPCQSLYSGPSGDMLADVAPYLLSVQPRGQRLRWLSEHWGRSAGVLLRTPADHAAVREHLRQWLMVTRPQDLQKYLFRFYDPRVLREFLPACSSTEAARFFGPVAAMYCEGPEADELLTFALGKDGAMVQSRKLSSDRAATGR
jgi:hypothetical protein